MNLIPALPEIFLLIATSAILLIDMFLPDAKRNITYMLSLLALAGCAVLSVMSVEAGTVTYTFNGMFVSDPMAQMLKLFSYLAVAVTLRLLARVHRQERHGQRRLPGRRVLCAGAVFACWAR